MIEEKIENNIALAQFTTFKIGGPARFFIDVTTGEEMINAIKWAKNNGHKFFILAGGSNVLINDSGFDGLIIKNSLKSIFREKTEKGTTILCGSGLPMSRIVLSAAKNSLTGMEWAIGLPGTIGGAIRSNAGCFGSETSAIVSDVTAYDPDNDKVITLSNEQCGFSYHHSLFKEKDLVILECKIKLVYGHKNAIQKRMNEIIGLRTQNQPKYFSAGCIFKNVPLTEIDNPELVEEAKKENKITGAGPEGLAAGWLIEKLYFKGKWVGGARVSLDHANFIINKHGKATASDVMMLISLIKQKIRVEFGIQLKEEITYVGY